LELLAGANFQFSLPLPKRTSAKCVRAWPDGIGGRSRLRCRDRLPCPECYTLPLLRYVRMHPSVALFLCVFAGYNLNCRPIPAGDSIGTALVPLRIAFAGTLTLDPYAPALARSYGSSTGILYHGDDGHYYSPYPVLQSILISPCYLPLRWIPGVRKLAPETTFLLARTLEKIAASLMAAASVSCFFLLIRRLAGTRRALLLACTYGLATNTWATSSQALWQHGASQLAIVLSLLSLQVFLDGERRFLSASAAALFAALAPCFRPTDIIFWLASFAMLWRLRHRGMLAAGYALAGILLGGAVAAYNLAVFHGLAGGYSNLFGGDLQAGLAGLTVSPARGLFVYSPVLLFSLFGVSRWLLSPHKRGHEIYAISVLFALAHLLVCAKWPVWWGGDCYGPRLLADLLPCMVLLILPALDWITARRPVRITFIAALSFSFLVQVIGTFCFPTGFVKPEALWDWRRCPIVLNARAGPAVAHYRALAMWGRQLASGKLPDWQAGGLKFR
jgi:hypothetical protein